MIKELETDTINLKKEVGDSNEYSGIQNILDDMIESINKYSYLRTLK